MKKITIYTDGGASGNPGPGGYGVVLLYGEHRKELTGGYRLTTNNRMEMLAVIEGLGALTQPCDVTVYSDSKYVVNGVEKGWAKRWQRNGWRRNKKGDVAKNHDLWQRMLDELSRHKARLEWVKGHAGIAENERCDALAVAATKGGDLPVDEGYENPQIPPPPQTSLM